MYAIVKVGGKQYRVEKGDSLVVDRLRAGEGEKVDLEPLLFRSDDDGAVFGGDELRKVKVEAVVSGHERGRKVHVLKFKPKRGYKRRSGHRSELTRLEVSEIKMLSRKPATKGEAGAGVEKAAAQEVKPAPKKPAARKPAAKRPATKKAAAKKPAAGKSETGKRGAGKTAAKKPAARKKSVAGRKQEDGDGS
jgi:large subunit ribosomal protein L21